MSLWLHWRSPCGSQPLFQGKHPVKQNRVIYWRIIVSYFFFHLFQTSCIFVFSIAVTAFYFKILAFTVIAYHRSVCYYTRNSFGNKIHLKCKVAGNYTFPFMLCPKLYSVRMLQIHSWISERWWMFEYGAWRKFVDLTQMK